MVTFPRISAPDLPDCDRSVRVWRIQDQNRAVGDIVVERIHSCLEMGREEGWTDPGRAIRPLTDSFPSTFQAIYRASTLVHDVVQFMV